MFVNIRHCLNFLSFLTILTFFYTYVSLKHYSFKEKRLKHFFSLFMSNEPLILAQRLPNALIIGAAKCGTSALIEFLSVHPQVSVSHREIDYFSNLENYKKGIKWYREQMPVSNQNQITIEKTPAYLVDENAAERVFQLNPNMKLIVIVRDPVTRAVSHYLHTKVNKGNYWAHEMARNQSITDDDMFQSFLYTPGTKTISQMDYFNSDILNHGLYYKHVRQWLRYFPLEQFLFINGERFRHEPNVEIEKVQTFLNLDLIIQKSHFVLNEKRGVYCVKDPLNLTK
jgi:hypothetical protein